MSLSPNRIIRKIQIKSTRFGRDLSQAPAHSKLGITMGGTSLAMGVANYKNNKENRDLNAEKQKIEEKSLTVLERIHKSLSTTKTPGEGV